MLNIVTIPNPLLRKKAEEVKKMDKKVEKLVDEMVDTLKNNPRGGIGLAAPQVGVSRRVIIVKNGRDDKKSAAFAIVNPEIVKKSKETETDFEGCLSIPDTYGKVKRAKRLVVKGLNRKGKKINLKAAGLFARVIQHETDHLDGILFTDKVEGKLLTETEYHKTVGSTETVD